MIKAEDGEVTFRGIKIHVMAEAATVLRALKRGTFRGRVQNGN